MKDAMPVVMESGEVSLPPAGKGFVYLAYAGDGCLLYVGATADLLGRIGEHRRTRAPWMPFTARITWQRYVNLDEAREAEMRLIGQLAPQFNSIHNTHAPRPACEHPTADEWATFVSAS